MPSVLLLRHSVLPLALALTACAAPAVRDAGSINASARVCCSSVSDLPSPEPATKERAVQLTPLSPHFNFGLGVAPFVQMALSPSTVGIELRTHAKAGGAKLLGGDGTFHYADVRLVFFDATMKPLEATTLSPAKLETVGLAGRYMFVANVAVPPSATSVVVTTNPNSVGQQSTATVRVSGGAAMVPGAIVPLPGGNATIPYTLSPYGEVTLITRP